STSCPITVPVTGTAPGAAFGNIRVIATATNPVFTKAMNGRGRFLNGEVEDYYVSYLFLLPLKLISFNAARINNNARLMWVTADEQYAESFDIEHSINGQDFTVIGNLPAAGISTKENIYSFVHNQPSIGNTHYYRLKIIERGGGFSYSTVRVLNFQNKNEKIIVYPNPVNSIATVTGLKEGEDIIVLGVDGKIEMNIKVVRSTESFDVSGLKTGLHLVKIMNQGVMVTAIKMIKE
ncbi:MAG: T9SS type A sorting domain-containing protein, partial [Bacteroidetes bacterium]|nr:T9SS type A sorting domain-containing protein [Bacteroidota bacterium]